LQKIHNLLKRPAIRQFIKYVMVGCFVTLIDMAALHLFYRVFHVSIRLSVILGFMCGNVSSFVLNKYFTFRNFSLSIFRQYAKYFLTSMTGLLWTVFLMFLFFEKWNLFAGFTQYNYLLCKMLVAALVMFWNFTIIKHWTLAEFNLGALKNFDNDKSVTKPYLSVIIPAYNEQNRLPSTLEQVLQWLKEQDFTWEIIVVDDGSTDNTVNVIKQKYPDTQHLFIHRLSVNQGKGAAVRTGMLLAKGTYRLFLDADHQIHISELSAFLPAIDANTILIGSKYLTSLTTQQKVSFARRFVSRLGNILIRFLFNLPIKDTQCGFKLFPGNVAENIFRLQKLNRFSFDVEVLTLATLFQLHIKEMPIVLHANDDSRIRTFRDSISVGIDLAKIKLNIWSRKYKFPQSEVTSEQKT